MSNNIVLAIDIPPTDGISKGFYVLSLETIRAYCERHNLKFEIISEKKYSNYDKILNPNIEKLQIGDYLKEYDRVLYFDCDILINKHAPNLFDLYTDNILYGVDEGVFHWNIEEVEKLESRKELNITFRRDAIYPHFINTGVVIWGQETRPFFEHFDIDEFIRHTDDEAHEQPYFNVNIQRYNIPYEFMKDKYNWLVYSTHSAFDERLNKEIIHYAGYGGGGHLLGKKHKGKQIKEDFDILFKEKKDV